jgi:DNA-binding transcriptional LysR family regulator
MRAARQGCVLQTDDLQVQVEACADGLGIVGLPDWVLYDRAQKGDLTLFSLQPKLQASTTAIYLLQNPGPMTAAIEACCQPVRKRIGSPAIWERVLQSRVKQQRAS